MCSNECGEVSAERQHQNGDARLPEGVGEKGNWERTGGKRNRGYLEEKDKLEKPQLGMWSGRALKAKDSRKKDSASWGRVVECADRRGARML